MFYLNSLQKLRKIINGKTKYIHIKASNCISFSEAFPELLMMFNDIVNRL